MMNKLKTREIFDKAWRRSILAQDCDLHTKTQVYSIVADALYVNDKNWLDIMTTAIEKANK